jgi:hypothetical protein
MDDSIEKPEAPAERPRRRRRREVTEDDLVDQTARLARRYGLLDREVQGITPYDRWINTVALAKLQEQAGELALRSCRHENKTGLRCWSCHPMILAVWRPGCRAYATFQWARGPQ